MDGAAPVVRALLGVGYYRSQSAPDLALYLGEKCYAGLTSIWCSVGIDASSRRPYIDHCDAQFEGACEVSIIASIKGRDSTREAHIRRARLIRDAWGMLGCPARGFAKSQVLSEDHRAFVRSFVDNWRTEPGKGKRVTLPTFEHSILSRAVAEGEHGLHTLTDDDRQALLAHFEGYKLDALQIACALGCSVKTVQSWRRKGSEQATVVQQRDDTELHRSVLASVAAIEVDWRQGLITPEAAMEQISEALQKLVSASSQT